MEKFVVVKELFYSIRAPHKSKVFEEPKGSYVNKIPFGTDVELLQVIKAPEVVRIVFKAPTISDLVFEYLFDEVSCIVNVNTTVEALTQQKLIQERKSINEKLCVVDSFINKYLEVKNDKAGI